MKSVLLLCLMFLALQSKAQEASQTTLAVVQNQSLIDQQNELRPFTSDACSFFIDKMPFGDAWAICCLKHDMAYWQGGTQEQKQLADETLKRCAVDGGHKVVAQFLYWGPHLFGGPGVPMPWRWGYGWKHNRGYRPLESSDRDQARQKLQNFVDALNDVVRNIDPN